MKKHLFFIALTLGIIACTPDYIDDLNFDCTTVTYSGSVSALAEATCNSSGCHNAGSSNGDFTTHEGLSGIGKFEFGLHVLGNNADMPINGSLTDEEKATFQCWVNDGFPDN